MGRVYNAALEITAGCTKSTGRRVLRVGLRQLICRFTNISANRAAIRWVLCRSWGMIPWLIVPSAASRVFVACCRLRVFDSRVLAGTKPISKKTIGATWRAMTTSPRKKRTAKRKSPPPKRPARRSRIPVAATGKKTIPDVVARAGVCSYHGASLNIGRHFFLNYQ